MNAKTIERMHIDLDEIRADIERNRQERLKFIDQYAEWLKRTPNKIWSKQQNSILGKK